MKQLRDASQVWDIIVIGGGATGLGTALDAASRGYSTLLLERSDFARGTSSRSTKLIHGGVRYLQQGNISLVLEALRERGNLLKNAPHVVHNSAFVVPAYRWWEIPFYVTGLKLYDLLAGKRGLGPSRWLSKAETLKRIPTLKDEGLKGGILYHDGQFDDSRLAVNLMQTLLEQGGKALNYTSVTGLLKSDGQVTGVSAVDTETGEEFSITSKVVINATGVFTDSVRQMDRPETEPIITVSQGVHIVLDREFLPGNSALMIPKTEDGRVLFAVPWHNRLIVGTTDTPVPTPSEEPIPEQSEIRFLLKHSAKYLTKAPTREDIRSVFTGLRPLVKPAREESTKTISREHTIITDSSGLVTITGGKWTTYRQMAEETVDHAASEARLPETPSITRTLALHGSSVELRQDSESALHLYGCDAPLLKKLTGEEPSWNNPMHKDLTIIPAEVIWAVRHEMARTVEDVLARRTRALFLDARASLAISEKVARLMAGELDRDEQWVKDQVSVFRATASHYLPG
ncbi:MAG: glycerol-3-phosphate dehydrogenase/oxidase [Balneolaceae bacterium]